MVVNRNRDCMHQTEPFSSGSPVSALREAVAGFGTWESGGFTLKCHGPGF